ncbi:hypothetical protein BpHYR1_035235 [Brachionus plicatilis]|uniref:Uncharacterized protein n=1 Tax=Brachionus plicatilis TaxID=10195 RepID=A0A3M7T9G9_BRAPC|nr:hypothetical protein BpHYR1_035235 [Brachionus plicatilis]
MWFILNESINVLIIMIYRSMDRFLANILILNAFSSVERIGFICQTKICCVEASSISMIYDPWPN